MHYLLIMCLLVGTFRYITMSDEIILTYKKWGIYNLKGTKHKLKTQQQCWQGIFKWSVNTLPQGLNDCSNEMWCKVHILFLFIKLFNI